jgi:hypothetical protein
MDSQLRARMFLCDFARVLVGGVKAVACAGAVATVDDNSVSPQRGCCEHGAVCDACVFGSRALSVLFSGPANLFSDTVEGPGGRRIGDVGIEFGSIPRAGCSDRGAGSVAAFSDEVRYACGCLGDLGRGM